jgi:hypothetical protein
MLENHGSQHSQQAIRWTSGVFTLLIDVRQSLQLQAKIPLFGAHKTAANNGRSFINPRIHEHFSMASTFGTTAAGCCLAIPKTMGDQYCSSPMMRAAAGTSRQIPQGRCLHQVKQALPPVERV